MVYYKHGILHIRKEEYKMSKCIKCGAKNPASAKFCIKRGRDLSLVFCPGEYMFFVKE